MPSKANSRSRSEMRGRLRWRSWTGIDADDSVAAFRLVREGLAYERLEAFRESSGLSLDTIGRAADISKRTLSRRRLQGRLRPDESDRLLRLSRIFGLAVELFEGDAAGARRWLQTPQPGLGGQVPLDFVATDVGAREIERLLGRLEHGVFA